MSVTRLTIGGLVLLATGCNAPSVESIQARVAESYFIEPQEAKFSEVYTGGGYVCGLVAGRARIDQFTGSRPFWADANGGSMEIMSAKIPEAFLITAARNCPSEFIYSLHDFTGARLRSFEKQAAGQAAQ